MIRELFEYLHLKDLVACSLVNKRWYSIYAAFKLHSLAITDHPYCYSNCLNFDRTKWYHSNRPFRKAERWEPAMFGRLVEKPLLSNLRQLALCDYSFRGFDLNELNRFEKLVHLEITTSWYSKKRTVQLNLPKLEVLAFHWNKHCLLFFDCPKLSTLLYNVCGEDANLLVKHPETIRKLQTNLVGSNLAKFKNVECLVTRKLEVISKATLLSLPRLRELNFIEDIENVFGGDTVDQVKRTLSEFLDEVKKLRNSDFRFTFAGFQLTNVKLKQIDFDVQPGKLLTLNECVYMKNYHLIEPGAIDFVQTVDYGSLLSNATGGLPHCFSQKFTDIRWVKAGDVIEDSDQLLWFLKSFGSLEILELETARLSQEFCDRLPASARSLLELLLHGDPENVLQLNFEFIGGFAFLSRLEILSPISLQSSTSLANSLSGKGPISVKYEIDPQICMVSPIPFLSFGITNRVKINKERCSKFWNISVAGRRPSNPKEIVNFFKPLQGPE